VGEEERMTHIICRASFCLFWDDGVCVSDEIIYEPDNGCLTLQDAGELDLEEEEEEELNWDDDSEDSLYDDEEDEDWDVEDGESWEEDY
jgi:hypothetical protein